MKRKPRDFFDFSWVLKRAIWNSNFRIQCASKMSKWILCLTDEFCVLSTITFVYHHQNIWILCQRHRLLMHFSMRKETTNDAEDERHPTFMEIICKQSNMCHWVFIYTRMDFGCCSGWHIIFDSENFSSNLHLNQKEIRFSTSLHFLFIHRKIVLDSKFIFVKLNGFFRQLSVEIITRMKCARNESNRRV